MYMYPCALCICLCACVYGVCYIYLLTYFFMYRTIILFYIGYNSGSGSVTYPPTQDDVDVLFGSESIWIVSTLL